MNISKNFTLEELCHSDKAEQLNIPNKTTTTQQVVNLCALVHNVLQPLRNATSKIDLSSGFRTPRINKLVGGGDNSQHLRGEAADIKIHGDKDYGRRIFKWIMDNCDFDQLIWEHEGAVYWVHVSYKANGQNRRQVINNLSKT
jgi:hypothetical protein